MQSRYDRERSYEETRDYWRRGYENHGYRDRPRSGDRSDHYDSYYHSTPRSDHCDYYRSASHSYYHDRDAPRRSDWDEYDYHRSREREVPRETPRIPAIPRPYEPFSRVQYGSPAPGARHMPKDFDPPLTCFFWATTGHCAKSDEDCWYAHHHTGVTATAPVALADGVPIAGREAASRLAQISFSKAKTVRDRINVIAAKEKRIAMMEDKAKQAEAKAQAMLNDVYEAMHTFNENHSGNIQNLQERRAEIAELALTEPAQQKALESALRAIDAAIDILFAARDQFCATTDRVINAVELEVPIEPTEVIEVGDEVEEATTGAQEMECVNGKTDADNEVFGV